MNKGLGCLPSKIDLRDYRLCSSSVKQDYPEKFLLENLPRIKDQGNVNSCCAHATSSILEYHAKNNYNLSTNFIYGIQKKLFNQCQMGMYLTDACKIAQQYGDMTERDCRGNSEIPKCYTIAEEALNNKTSKQKAFKFRINSYYLCSKDEDIKFALMNYGPVLGAVIWRDSYMLGKDGVVYFDRSVPGGGHAVMIVGWDSRGWIIQNSWGDKFANEGRFILPYDYGFIEARAIIDESNENEFNELVLHKPLNNKFLNVFYKIANFFVNIVKHKGEIKK